MAIIDFTQDTSLTAAEVGNGATEVRYKKFSWSKGSAPVTGDVFQIWDIPARARIIAMNAQAPDLADGNWMIGDGTDPNLFLDVADASTAITPINNALGMGKLYLVTDTLDVTMGTLTTASDVTFTVEVWYEFDYTVSS